MLDETTTMNQKMRVNERTTKNEDIDRKQVNENSKAVH